MSEAPTDGTQSLPGQLASDPRTLEPPAEIEGRGGLRRVAARGTIVNSAFQIGFAGLGLLQRLVVAAFLTREEFGVWGVILTTLVTLAWLKQLGIGDKYIQQSEADQVGAFQKAFTLELIVSALFFVFLMVAIPLYALAYGHDELVAPGLVLSTLVLFSAFETPIWIPYRRMQYVRQRTLGSVNPLVTFFVTSGLAVAGGGYWSLVIGAVAGSVAGGAVATLTCPYPLRLRFERSTVRDYASFSWPLVGEGMSNLIAIQGTLFIANRVVGLAGVGAIALAVSIANFADRVDGIVSQTIYPAVCRVTDRIDLLHETFIKSNRIILMWAMPFGVALALFAHDLVDFVLGERWEPAANLMVGVGLVAAFHQIGFNWAIFMRAVNNTKPILTSSLLLLGVFALVVAPLLVTLELTGYVLGFAAATVIQVAIRCYYLQRLFPGRRVAQPLARAIAPSLPPAALILLIRAATSGDRTLSLAVGELGLYIAATIAFTLWWERTLIREVLGYLKARSVGTPQMVAAGDR